MNNSKVTTIGPGGTPAILLALGVSLLLGAAQAQATVLPCGSTIFAHTRLDANMTCPGSAITFGADNITLDVNGHTISGPGCTTGGPFGTTGINTNNHSHLLIKGPGTVKNFQEGVRVLGGNGVRVDRLNIVCEGSTDSNRAGVGIILLGSGGGSIDSNTIANFARGILLESSLPTAQAVSAEILRNEISFARSFPVGCGCITLIQSSNWTLNHNTCRNSGFGSFGEPAGIGLYVSSNKNHVVANTAVDGFLVSPGDQVAFSSTDNDLVNNLVRNMPGPCYQVAFATGNRLVNNTAVPPCGGGTFVIAPGNTSVNNK